MLSFNTDTMLLFDTLEMACNYYKQYKYQIKDIVALYYKAWTLTVGNVSLNMSIINGHNLSFEEFTTQLDRNNVQVTESQATRLYELYVLKMQ